MPFGWLKERITVTNSKKQEKETETKAEWFEEEEFSSAAERHSIIMAEGARFFRRLAWGCFSLIVVIVGFIIFMLTTKSQYWRYP